MSLRVSSLFIHPIKSAAAIAVDELLLDELGAVNDRRWMLVDGLGRFFTQRELGALALIRVQVRADGLTLHSDGRDSLHIDVPHDVAVVTHATVWGDSVPVWDAGDVAAEWCSAVVSVQCRLVYLAPTAARPLHPKYAGSVNPEQRHVALSDGAPLLIIGEGSLRHLNERLAERGIKPVGLDRFRPNLVIAGAAPHEEDTWRTIRIGDTIFGVGTPCPRCVMTTIEQHTGRRAPQQPGEQGGEPLRTLATYRRQGTGVMFGMNVTNATAGMVRVGDAVTVTEFR